VSTTLRGTYDHGRLILEGTPPFPLATVLVTFLDDPSACEMKPFRSGDFSFDECRGKIQMTSGSLASDAVGEDREERA